jgi:hypothetical protein
VNPTFKVRFYDAKASRKGKGVKVAYFTDRAEADAFAAGKTLYARPAVAEPVEPLTVEQTRIALGVAS